MAPFPDGAPAISTECLDDIVFLLVIPFLWSESHGLPRLPLECCLILPVHFRPLSRNPFTDILRAIPELRSVVLGKRKELDSITVNNRHVLEIDSECARFLSKRIPEGVHMLPGKLPAYEQHDKTI